MPPNMCVRYADWGARCCSAWVSARFSCQSRSEDPVGVVGSELKSPPTMMCVSCLRAEVIQRVRRESVYECAVAGDCSAVRYVVRRRFMVAGPSEGCAGGGM